MKKLLLFSVLFCGCSQQPVHQQTVIERMCQEFESYSFTPEEVAHWDSMNADGGYILLRGAERDLDTIVNHIHLIFITEE